MVQYDFSKVYVRDLETKQDVFVQKMSPIWPIQGWPRFLIPVDISCHKK